eukprot:1158657-Pelagomonas_calceolata.AAC.2
MGSATQKSSKKLALVRFAAFHRSPVGKKCFSLPQLIWEAAYTNCRQSAPALTVADGIGSKGLCCLIHSLLHLLSVPIGTQLASQTVSPTQNLHTATATLNSSMRPHSQSTKAAGGHTAKKAIHGPHQQHVASWREAQVARGITGVRPHMQTAQGGSEPLMLFCARMQQQPMQHNAVREFYRL